jgi:hypothetical protein
MKIDFHHFMHNLHYFLFSQQLTLDLCEVTEDAAVLDLEPQLKCLWSYSYTRCTLVLGASPSFAEDGEFFLEVLGVHEVELGFFDLSHGFKCPPEFLVGLCFGLRTDTACPHK